MALPLTVDPQNLPGAACVAHEATVHSASQSKQGIGIMAEINVNPIAILLCVIVGIAGRLPLVRADLWACMGASHGLGGYAPA